MKRQIITCIATASLVALGHAGETLTDERMISGTGDQWPCWRGPDHNGAIDATGFELDWSNHPPRIAWSAPAGIGFSSPIIFENTVLLFDHQDGMDRLRRWNLFTGDEVWSTQWEARAYREDVRGKYPGPLSTPAYRAGAVYLLDRASKVRCFDVKSGDERWVHDVETGEDLFGFQDPKRMKNHGPEGSSPYVLDGVVIVSGHRACVGLGPVTGRTLWVTAHGEGEVPKLSGAFATPIPYGNERILMAAWEGVNCLDPVSGKLLWRQDLKPTSVIADPVLLPDDRLFHCDGYARRCLVASLKRDDPGELWSNDQLIGNKIASPVANGPLVFGFGAGGFGKGKGGLGCVDTANGSLLWSHAEVRGRLIRIGDVLLVQQRQGSELVLINADRTGAERGRVRIPGLGGRQHATPAAADGWMVCRGTTELFAIDSRQETQKEKQE